MIREAVRWLRCRRGDPAAMQRQPDGNALARARYQLSTRAKISGATMVASDSMMNFGVSTPSLPQVIFSFGTAPEYEP